MFRDIRRSSYCEKRLTIVEHGGNVYFKKMNDDEMLYNFKNYLLRIISKI